MIDASPRSGYSPALDCEACGACCAYSADWPRFSLEDEAAISRIPSQFVDHARCGMRCEGDRCSALTGEVGVSTRCSVYAVRPDVCRACLPGDEACLMARHYFGLDTAPIGRAADVA